jgi:hypothetical protein
MALVMTFQLENFAHQFCSRVVHTMALAPAIAREDLALDAPANSPGIEMPSALAKLYHGAKAWDLRLFESSKLYGTITGSKFVGGPDLTAPLRLIYSRKPGGGAHHETAIHVSHVHPFRLSSFGLEMDRMSAHYLWEKVGLHAWTLTEQEDADSILRLWAGLRLDRSVVHAWGTFGDDICAQPKGQKYMTIWKIPKKMKNPCRQFCEHIGGKNVVCGNFGTGIHTGWRTGRILSLRRDVKADLVKLWSSSSTQHKAGAHGGTGGIRGHIRPMRPVTEVPPTMVALPPRWPWQQHVTQRALTNAMKDDDLEFAFQENLFSQSPYAG